MQNTHSSSHATRLLAIALLGAVISLDPVRAYVPAPPDPSFVTLLEAQPIVVVARVDVVVDGSKKTFESIAGDIDNLPEFTEEYRHYRLRTTNLLKGDLPSVFEVRVIAGSRNHVLLDRALGEAMFLILAPDSGLDEQGLPRSSFLIAHGAAYPVRDGEFQAQSDQGRETWSIERSAALIERFRREREQRRVESPEPDDKGSDVFAGEDGPGVREETPPEAPELRERRALPPESLSDAAPRAFNAPRGDVDTARPRN